MHVFKYDDCENGIGSVTERLMAEEKCVVGNLFELRSCLNSLKTAVHLRCIMPNLIESQKCTFEILHVKDHMVGSVLSQKAPSANIRENV